MPINAISPSRRGLRLLLLVFLLQWNGQISGWPVAQAGQIDEPNHVASIVVDAHTGAVGHAFNANRKASPASLNKLMTAYLVLEALEDGRVAKGSRWLISRYAAGQPPTKMYLKAGTRVAVETLLAALFVVSANDAAVALAEGLMGGEAAFVRRMNVSAQALGMADTQFQNASGLPAEQQFTTARDMAVLVRTLWQRFAGYNELFKQRELRFAKRHFGTVNAFVTNYPGADGMKTGFTCRAGFNLAASATKNDQRKIAIVLGAATRAQRARTMRELMDQSFAPRTEGGELRDVVALQQDRTQGGDKALSRRIIAQPCLSGATLAVKGWSIDLGAHRQRGKALKMARGFLRSKAGRLRGARVRTLPRWIGVQWHRALVTGLKREAALKGCLAFREGGGDCVIISPESLRAQIADADRLKKLQRLAKAGKPSN